MIAKYDGNCKMTKEKIIAGETEVEKISGNWVRSPEYMASDEDEVVRHAVEAWRTGGQFLRVVTLRGEKDPVVRGMNFDKFIQSYKTGKDEYRERGFTIHVFPGIDVDVAEYADRLSLLPEDVASRISIKNEAARGEDNDLDKQFWDRDA